MYMLAAGSKGATQSEILNKEWLLSRETLTKTPTQNSKIGFSAY